GARRPVWRYVRRSCAPSPLAPPTPSRRRSSATTRKERSPPRPSSAVSELPPCGSIFAPARRRRLATRRSAPRRSRHGIPPTRRDCGSRFRSAGRRCPRRGTVLPWCIAAQSASFAPSLARQPDGPPTLTHGATPGLWPRPDWLIRVPCFNASPRRAGLVGGLSRSRPFKATKSHSPAPLQAAERLRKPRSGERPAGLRTTRAELFEAKTAPLIRQGLVAPRKQTAKCGVPPVKFGGDSG